MKENALKCPHCGTRLDVVLTESNKVIAETEKKSVIKSYKKLGRPRKTKGGAGIDEVETPSKVHYGRGHPKPKEVKAEEKYAAELEVIKRRAAARVAARKEAEGSSLVCGECGKVCLSPSGLSRHKTRKHGAAVIARDSALDYKKELEDYEGGELEGRG